jgi:biopolymer transport protein ExbD
MRVDTGNRLSPTPNVTPMVDVMLVLLIIFMVVTPALQSGVIAEPPTAENLLERPQSEDDHTLAIDQSGALYLDRVAIAPEQLESALRVHYPPTAIDRVLYIRAHRELPYASVRDAMHVASVSGVAVVALVSEQRRP